MRRWLLGVALLLGPAVGLASADYIILKVDLNKLFNPQAGAYDPKAPGVQPGAQPAPLQQPYDLKGAPDSKETPVWAYAYLEQRGKKVDILHYPDPYKQYGGAYHLYKVEQRWGKTLVTVHSNNVGKHIGLAPVHRRFAERVDALKKEGKTAEKLLVLAQWALEHGLFAECERTMDELKALDPANTIGQAFQKTRDTLSAAPTRDDPAAAALLSELTKAEYKKVPSEHGHYTLLTNVKSPTSDAGVKRRLARMENTFKGFFYWFALHGRPQAVPSYRLVAVLVKTDWSDSKEFDETYESFNRPMLVGDGFTAQRDNVVILASTSYLDEVFQFIQKNNQQKFAENSVTSADLLGDPKDPKIAKKLNPLGQKVPLMQLAAVLQHAMEEDAETATVSHECARQLAAATGLLPRNVNTGEWARFGLASFFETAPHGFYTTVGGPNWAQLVRWRYLLKKGKLKVENAKNILLDVVGDSYFQRADQSRRQLYEISEGRDALEPKAHKELRLAQATGWSLTHFLARDHLGKLLAYYDELSSLPRDVEYDAEVLRGCFARAFGLLTKDPSGGQKQVLDMRAVDKLAKEWFSAIAERPIDVDGYEAEEFKRLEDEDNPPPPPKTDPNDTTGTQRPYTTPGYRPGPGARPSGPGRRPSGPSGPGGRPYGPGGGRGGRPGGG